MKEKICTFLCKWEISVQNFEHLSFFFTCHMYKGVMFFFRRKYHCLNRNTSEKYEELSGTFIKTRK